MSTQASFRMSMIGDLASEMRLFLEPLWEGWKVRTGRGSLQEPTSSSMCGFTSAFLANALTACDGHSWCMVGGSPRHGGGGVKAADGVLHPHFWTISDDGLLLDLTGDQFGLPSPVVSRREDRRYLESFDGAFIEAHLPRVLPVAEEWLGLAECDGIIPATRRLAA